MKKAPSWTRPLLALALGLAAAGCPLLTTDDVRRAVDESNRAIADARTVLEATGDLAPIALHAAERERPPGAFDHALEEIDAALAQVEPRSRTADALLFRKGWLLLNARRFDTARAAFDELSAEPVRERDRALYALREPLIFWYRYAPAAGEELHAFSVRPGALLDPRAALDELTRGIDDGAWEGEIRHWLEIQRALFALKLVAHVYQDEPGESFPRLNEALARYAGSFTPLEREAVTRWAEGSGPLEGARWYLAPAVLVREFRRARDDADPPPDGAPPPWPESAEWLLALYAPR